MVPPATSATASPTASAGDALSQDERADRARQLFENHSGQVLRFLRRRDPDLAEDALSETFAVAVRRAADIPSGHELPWLYVVAEHVLRNLQRSRRRAARIPEALQPLVGHAAQPIDVPVVGEALGELPDRERILLTMTAFEGLSASEAADQMGISYGSARNALSSGRKRLAVVLASAAAVIVVVGTAVAAIAERSTHRGESLQTLASSLSQAGIVHDVAIVRQDDTAATDQAARYERWSDRDDDRTRVRLPGGGEVVAPAGQTLRAAGDQLAHPTAPTKRRAVREDLATLDAASPAAIGGLLADASAQRTAADGPTIAGHDTTTIRGRITDAAGVEHAVRVFVSDDAPAVLRVRVREVRDGHATDRASTVDFTAWKTVPRTVIAAPDATTPTTPGATTPASASGAPRDHASAPTTDDGRLPRDSGSTASPGHAKVDPPTDARPASALATAPIVHVRQNVEICSTPQYGTPSCYDYGDREVWLELGGARRSLSKVRRTATSPVRNEEWTTPTESRSYSVSKDGERIYGWKHRFTHAEAGRTAPVPEQWRGVWLDRLDPVITELRGSPAAVEALPAGPEIDGRPSRVKTVTLADGPVMPYSVDIAVDASTREPLQIRFSRSWGPDGSSGDSATLKIHTWEQLPAGENGGLLTRDFPKGARMHTE